MKGLLKYLSPFAPDQSGAASVLFDLGAITVICDAGGCTGNICGFDEPRWFVKKSAIFSAGLRDMDAILGRDDRLVVKLKDVAKKVDANFAALIGTPVPAVIATDFQALKRMAKKRCELPVIAIECTGTKLYDEGQQPTYLALFKEFANQEVEKEESSIGIIGATPLNLSSVIADQKLRAFYREQGYAKVYCYGMGDGFEAIKKAGRVKKNIVIAPSGLKAAKYLKKTFGTPYECAYPILDQSLKEQVANMQGKKILVIQQQVMANAIREEILKKAAADVTVASWFMLKKEGKQPQDVSLKTEQGFADYVREQNFDVIIGDAILARACREFKGSFIPCTHFAVSGEYEHEDGESRI